MLICRQFPMGSIPITRSTPRQRQASCGNGGGGKILIAWVISWLLRLRTDDHRVLALEVKTRTEVTDEDVNHLLWLREQLGSTLADMVVITTGKHAYRRQDGVAIVPAALLGP